MDDKIKDKKIIIIILLLYYHYVKCQNALIKSGSPLTAENSEKPFDLPDLTTVSG